MMINFTITGPVASFAEITPSKVILKGPLGTPIKEQVLVMASEKNPFKIIGSKARVGQYIRVEVKETKDNSGRPGYLINIENTKTDAGNYRDNIFLETDSKIQSKINLPVLGMIRDPSRQQVGP